MIPSDFAVRHTERDSTALIERRLPGNIEVKSPKETMQDCQKMFGKGEKNFLDEPLDNPAISRDPRAMKSSVARLRSVEVLLIGLLSLALFLPFALSRLIGQDEGFYLYAAKLVMAGKIPYIDFFYPQTPAIPYLWGLWLSIAGFTWDGARALSAVLTSLLVIVAYCASHVRFGRKGAILIALALTLSPWSWAFFLWAKPFIPTTLLLFIAFALIEVKPQGRWTPFLAGCAIGLATCMRLYAACVAPLYLAALLFRQNSGEKRGRAVLLYIIGGIVGGLPLLVLFGMNPDLFWFNNVTYHLNRQNFSPEEIDANRLLVLKGLFLPTDSGEVAVLHFPLFALLTAAHCLQRAFRIQLPSLACASALILCTVSAIPVPTYVQYFILAFPFFIWTSAEWIQELSQSRQKAAQIAIVASITLFVFRIPTDWTRYTVRGEGLVSREDSGWVRRSTLRHVRRVSSVINQHTTKGEKILAMWPGHLLETHAEALSGLENHFGVRIATKLEIENDPRRHIISRSYLDSLMHSGEVRVIVVFPSSATYIVPRVAVLKRLGYQRVFSDAGVSVFVRAPAS